MTDANANAAIDEESPKKRSKLPLVIGLVLALAGGAGGFFAVQSGMLGGSDQSAVEAGAEKTDPMEPLPEVAFVEVPPLTISLSPTSQASHLRFRASLEVPSQYEAEVAGILPRVQDVLNSYLRALDPSDLQSQGALVKLRAQMLRRVKLVAGKGRVRDLLVLEFVLN
ncbi:flagellar basal body-associated FliL family protein [Thalassococcus lentus]|uniref:Flagellar protein FliL n=1 Tax=Thalassococcus lentus TaxID=1210524 RepID=A0ABT4XMU2_9RHOB|nr:flagellar basal body-associated FliL family protein [Thalassococcus lentus]MDA7423264.1 flagellar basal body-associated FliL family protein [Thalassococcus lentus]